MTRDLSFVIDTDHFATSGAVQAPSDVSTRAQSPLNQYLRQRSSGFASDTASNVMVNETTAMKFAAVFASIRVISESKASLPIKLYEITNDGRETEVKSHPVAELLSVEPNPDQTPMVYHEFQQSQVLSRGNSYAQIHYDSRGNVTELEPIHPENVEIGRDTATRRLAYRITDGNGETRLLDQSQMLHIPGLGGDGISGWSPIRLAAESIGIGLANERFAGKYFGEFARPSLVIEAEGNLGEEYDRLKADLENNYSGDNVGRPLLLEGGMKGKPISIPLNECQFLESREFQGKEIACRWYRIPAQIAGYGDDAKYDHMEQADLFFAKHTLGPWITRDEQEYRRKLFRPGERLRWKIKHNMDALQRADIKTRYEAHQSAIVAGWKTRNEVRQLEDLNPVDGGDELILPASVFGDQPASEPTDPDDRTDPRLKTMVKRAVEGLIKREIEAIKRHQNKSDATSRLNEFYEKHQTLFRDRFADITTDAGYAEIKAIVDEHRREVTAGGRHSGRHIAQIIECWKPHTDRITELILEKTTV